MSEVWVNDLRTALELGCTVELHHAILGRKLTGVRDLDEEAGYVVIDDPQTFRDHDTTKTILIADIVALTLMPDSPYRRGDD